jgi:hypothetical protein
MGHVVVDCIVCPTNFKQLSKKFAGLTEDYDNRMQQIDSMLSSYPTISVDDRAINQNISFDQVIQGLESKYMGAKIIRVCGVDGARSVGSKTNVIFVNNGRTIPEGCGAILRDHITLYQPYCRTISSTIMRFVNKRSYHPLTVSKFSIDWLTDMGITLDKEPCDAVPYNTMPRDTARRMMLGDVEVVVQYCALNDQYTVEHFNAQVSQCSASKLYYHGIVDGVGLIVTDSIG